MTRSPKDEPYVFKGKYDLMYEIHPNFMIDTDIAKNGIIQDWITFNLINLVGNNATILDIGANIGIYTLPFAKMCNKGQVYAFEPDHKNFKQLKNNINLNKLDNIHLFECAMQDNPNVTELDFYIKRCYDDKKLINCGLSTLEKNPYNNRGSYKVKCSTIDKFVNENKLTHIDLIKVDVEGSEFKVFSGGTKSIIKYLPFIHYEYSSTLDKRNENSNGEKCFEFLQKMGYVQYMMINNNLELTLLPDLDKKLSDCNILAIPKDKNVDMSFQNLGK